MLQHLTMVCFAVAMFILQSCGADPSFYDLEKTKGRSGDSTQASDDPGVKKAGGVPDGQTGPGEPPPGQMIAPEDITIPAADEDDVDDLQRCLVQWSTHPFGATVTNYKRIFAAVTVGGTGNAINDRTETSTPQLVLITAGVNVGGTPVYNLLNPNGWYCLKVNVNVLTDFTINLHCAAHMADSRVNVNVGSTTDDTTSAIGVHVMSTVHINDVKPANAACIR